MAVRFQRVADRADAAVHHVGRGDDVAAGLRLHEGLGDQLFDGGVIGDAIAVEHAVMAVRGEGVERDIADHTDIGRGVLDGADCIGHQTVRIEGLGTGIILLRRIDMRENRHRRNTQILGFLRRLRQCGKRQAVDARHRHHRFDRIGRVGHHDGPDQIVHCQGILAHEAARPVGLTGAAKACGRVHGGRVSLSSEAGMTAGVCVIELAVRVSPRYGSVPDRFGKICLHRTI